eukprot:CAMPEP_0184546366 /NCGR_PEP_ID=MMETSP0199_2-20130426/4915_1 /TAXON_ID=1112570 /ORGANISM="Thraustochytrium sp., Strain LLF1b" /LENGTH=87 /DNA_ID=CAMNT_0026940765 /DNA_START=291 /DNA_END=551 /DNA_ORIENTATION=-
MGDEVGKGSSLEALDEPFLEQGVVKAILVQVLGSDLKIHSDALKLTGEYLRLVTQEAIDRSISAAKSADQEDLNLHQSKLSHDVVVV